MRVFWALLDVSFSKSSLALFVIDAFGDFEKREKKSLPRHDRQRSTHVRTRTDDAFARRGRRDKIVCEGVVRRPEDGDEDTREEGYDED